MTKRIFEIETPDDMGPMWMNADILLVCLTAYCEKVEFGVRDLTNDRFSGANWLQGWHGSPICPVCGHQAKNAEVQVRELERRGAHSGNAVEMPRDTV